MKYEHKFCTQVVKVMKVQKTIEDGGRGAKSATFTCKKNYVFCSVVSARPARKRVDPVFESFFHTYRQIYTDVQTFG